MPIITIHTGCYLYRLHADGSSYSIHNIEAISIFHTQTLNIGSGLISKLLHFRNREPARINQVPDLRT